MVLPKRCALLAGAILATAMWAPQSRAKEDGLDRRALLWVESVSYQSWMAKLRACTPADVKEATQSSTAARKQPKQKSRLSLEGRLMPGRADCTLKACKPGPCCNGCDFDWVIETARAPIRELRLRLAGARLPLSGGGPDCAVHVDGRVADLVIASGRMDGDDTVLVDAELCRLQPTTTNEQLTDADYRRLMPTKRRPPKRNAPK